jgi:AraC-like DNA-binding protein
MQVYSTRDVDYRHRLEYWSALASEAITPMTVDAGKACASFEGRLWSYRLGAIDVSRAYSTAAIIRRTGTDVGRTRDRSFLVSISEDNNYSMRTASWERIVRPNDLVITDATQRGLILHSGCTALTLRVPEERFKQHVPGVDDVVGLVVPGDRGAGLLAATMIRALAPNKVDAFDPSSAEHLATAVLHAIAAAYAEAFDARVIPASTAAARRYEITQFVDANLHDADLSVAQVAAAFGVSDRYVRMLFEESDESLSAYIQRRRLEESARQLRDPLWRSRTVSEIAFSWGFNSLGSYDRAFKARFDMTPREYRARAAKAQS